MIDSLCQAHLGEEGLEELHQTSKGQSVVGNYT